MLALWIPPWSPPWTPNLESVSAEGDGGTPSYLFMYAFSDYFGDSGRAQYLFLVGNPIFLSGKLGRTLLLQGAVGEIKDKNSTAR